MAFEIEGKLIKVYDTENKSGSFQAREFVIETKDGSYSQFIKFQLVQDRCSLIDTFKEGEMVKVSFDLRGREWQGKYFTNLNAWRVERATGGAESTAKSSPPPAAGAEFPSAKDEPHGTGDIDDLPF
jgi:hypothetical protein